MSLINYYKQTLGSNTLVENESPFYRQHSFKLTVPDSMLRSGEKLDISTINGIVDQLPEIHYSTGWDLSPISTITKKIEEFTDCKLIRAIATTNADYRPPLFTDGWTQKMTKNGSPLSVDFSFRSYPLELYNTTSYKDILKFLIYITTPREYYGENSIDVTTIAMKQAEKDGVEIGQQVQSLVKTFKASDMSFGDLRKELMDPKEGSKASEIYTQFKSLMTSIEGLANKGDNNIGGAPLCNLEIGKTIKANPKIFWMVKSWSFKPSVNTSVVKQGDDKYNIDPIYVDFKVSFESQQIFTSTDLESVLLFNK